MNFVFEAIAERRAGSEMAGVVRSFLARLRAVVHELTATRARPRITIIVAARCARTCRSSCRPTSDSSRLAGRHRRDRALHVVVLPAELPARLLPGRVVRRGAVPRAQLRLQSAAVRRRHHQDRLERPPGDLDERLHVGRARRHQRGRIGSCRFARFGGRQVVGAGFGVPLVLRYVLEFCMPAPTKRSLRSSAYRCTLSYNVTVLDASGKFVTAYPRPDQPALIRAGACGEPPGSDRMGAARGGTPRRCSASDSLYEQLRGGARNPDDLVASSRCTRCRCIQCIRARAYRDALHGGVIARVSVPSTYRWPAEQWRKFSHSTGSTRASARSYWDAASRGRGCTTMTQSSRAAASLIPLLR